MENELIIVSTRKPLLAPILIRLGMICALLLPIGWFFLRLSQAYGAARLAQDGNEFAGPALGFVLFWPWGGLAFLSAKDLGGWVRAELEMRKDGITQIVVHTQYIEIIRKPIVKTHRWADFIDHAYIENIFNRRHFALHLTASDGTYIMIDDRSYSQSKVAVNFLNQVIPNAMLPGLLHEIRKGNAVEIFPYSLNSHGISGEGKAFQWDALLTLHVCAWRDCELIFRDIKGDLETLIFECENSKAYIAPDLVLAIMRDHKREIETILDSPIPPG